MAGARFTNPVQYTVNEIKFNADTEQRVEMKITINKKRYKIAHIFHPVLDEKYFEYAKHKKLVQKISGTDTVQSFHFMSEDENLRAAGWLWDKLIIQREGYVKSKNWRERVSIQEKSAAIMGLLGVAINDDDEAIVDAEEGELLDDAEQDAIESVVVLGCLYNSCGLVTRHYFAAPSARDVEEFYRINRRSTSVGRLVRNLFKSKASAEIHVRSQAKALAKLYDKLIEKTEGYEGRVPAYHKDITVVEVFAQEN